DAQSAEDANTVEAIASLNLGESFFNFPEKLPSNLQSLNFGPSFNQSLEDLALPRGLQSLAFGDSFNWTLDGTLGTLPNLQSLTFGSEFNRSLDALPSSLRTLTLGDSFNQSLRGVTLPGSLETLAFGRDFNQSLDGVSLPDALQTLTFGSSFNRSLASVALPNGLQTLRFGKSFNQSLGTTTLPSGLLNLRFGSGFNQSLAGAALSSLTSLVFGCDEVVNPEEETEDVIDQCLEGVVLPGSLHTLTLGKWYQQSLSAVALPSSLQTLTLGAYYNSLEGVVLPSNLQTLIFGEYFNKSLRGVALPISLQTLTLGQEFNQSLADVVLLNGLKALTLGYRFNKTLEGVTLPSSLQTLIFGSDYNQSLEGVMLPSSLQSLTFGDDFDQSLRSVILPKNLRTLTFGTSFNQSLVGVTLPKSLQTLSFGWRFDQSLDGIVLPSSLQTLTFGECFEQGLGALPNSLQNLQTLTFGCHFNQSLEGVTLPSGLRALTFGSDFNQSLTNAGGASRRIGDLVGTSGYDSQFDFSEPLGVLEAHGNTSMPSPPPSDELGPGTLRSWLGLGSSAHAKDPLEEYLKACGGKKAVRRILVASNGMAAAKVMMSMRQWAHMEAGLGSSGILEFVSMATREDLDANAEFIRLADKHVEVPAGKNVKNYANVDLICKIAQQEKVDAVWPGWGHASENPRLPAKLKESGIAFIGPTSPVMSVLGDKIAAGILAQTAGVPSIPWSGDGLTAELTAEGTIPDETFKKACLNSVQDAVKCAERIGYPVMLKASEGGGGKGIRMSNNKEELEQNFPQVQAEVPGSPIFMMQLCTGARHIEVQIVGDQQGAVVALSGRDCSTQRRFQKIFEEGPPVIARGSERD
ncbi:unnamed protein product, partial [Effrenium voratum]